MNGLIIWVMALVLDVEDNHLLVPASEDGNVFIDEVRTHNLPSRVANGGIIECHARVSRLDHTIRFAARTDKSVLDGKF